jgi:hypothetical protein
MPDEHLNLKRDSFLAELRDEARFRKPKQLLMLQ